MDNTNDEAPMHDPFRSEVVERALRRYIGLLPDEAITEMRSFLTDALATHPLGSALLHRARPRAAPGISDQTVQCSEERSDTVAKEGDRGAREKDGTH